MEESAKVIIPPMLNLEKAIYERVYRIVKYENGRRVFNAIYPLLRQGISIPSSMLLKAVIKEFEAEELKISEQLVINYFKKSVKNKILNVIKGKSARRTLSSLSPLLVLIVKKKIRDELLSYYPKFYAMVYKFSQLFLQYHAHASREDVRDVVRRFFEIQVSLVDEYVLNYGLSEMNDLYAFPMERHIVSIESPSPFSVSIGVASDQLELIKIGEKKGKKSQVDNYPRDA